MGLFDTFFGGKENPNQTIYDPTAEERKRAMAMALLQGGAGILANNRGHYGQFAPALGAGISQGIQGYQQGLSEGPERRMKEMQQQLYAQQVNAQMQRAKADNQDDEIARGTFQTVFQDSGYDPETGGFMNVSNTPQPIKASPVPFLGEGEMSLMGEDLSYTPPAKPNPMDAIIDELGWTPGRKKFFMAQYKADPKSAMKTLQNAYIEMDRSSRKGRAEARDVLAKEKAIAEAMGVPLGQYLQKKADKSGVNLTIENYAGDASKKMAQKEGYDIGEQAAMVENKWSAVDSVREAKAILSQGIYGGYWGDVGQKVAKASMGAIGDRQKAARTEEFMAYIGNTVVPRLKEFGGNDSNEEMRYLQKIMGGDTSMEPEAIANILDSAERKIMRGIERLQRQRGALEQGKMPSLDAGPSRMAPKPQSGTPKGIDPKVWQYMTPQERALWQK